MDCKNECLIEVKFSPMPKRPPLQKPLFDDAAPTPGAPVKVSGIAVGPVKVVGPRTALSKPQREFNRLSARIRRLRGQIAEWQAFLPRFAERIVVELEPKKAALRGREIELARAIDTLLSASPAPGGKLTRAQRETLVGHLLTLLDGLLDVEPEEELEAMYDRYSEISRHEQRALNREFAETMLGEMFGAESLAGVEGEGVEDLLRNMQRKLVDEEEAARQARQRQRAEAGTGKRGGSASERAAERRAESAREAKLSMREIFRKLVSTLHPDRENDSAERERKTTLMQRVNQAYQRKDLLELLSLQIEIEQIDDQHLAGLPEQRLRHYNHVLEDQVRTLETELNALSSPLLLDFDLTPRPDNLPMLDRVLSQWLAEIRRRDRALREELAALADPKRRRTLLEQLRKQAREEDDFDALDDIFGFADWPFPPDLDDDDDSASARKPGARRRR